MHSTTSAALEKAIFQRNQARRERDCYLALIRKLIELDEAPRSVHFSRAWQSALEDAREALADEVPAHRLSAQRTHAA